MTITPLKAGLIGVFVLAMAWLMFSDWLVAFTFALPLALFAYVFLGEHRWNAGGGKMNERSMGV